MTNMSASACGAARRWWPVAMALVLACCLMAPTAPTHAADSTYQATVPVANTSTDARGKAFVDALEHVLARVAGHPLDSTPDADTAATYVQQYQYRRAPEGAAEPFVLSVTFAPEPVRHLARQMGATVADEADDTDAPADAEDADADLVTAAPSDQVVWVSGIHSGRDFADAVHALASMTGIEDVAVTAAEGDGMRLRVHTVLAPEHFAEALVRNGDFTDAGTSRPGAAASLHWQK